jgi:hypothetical protein
VIEELVQKQQTGFVVQEAPAQEAQENTKRARDDGQDAATTSEASAAAPQDGDAKRVALEVTQDSRIADVKA